MDSGQVSIIFSLKEERGAIAKALKPFEVLILLNAIFLAIVLI